VGRLVLKKEVAARVGVAEKKPPPPIRREEKREGPLIASIKREKIAKLELVGKGKKEPFVQFAGKGKEGGGFIV